MPAAQDVGLADIVGLVVSNSNLEKFIFIGCAARKALRGVSKAVREACDAAAAATFLTINASRVPDGPAGAAALARFFRPIGGRKLPTDLQLIRDGSNEPSAGHVAMILAAAAGAAQTLRTDFPIGTVAMAAALAGGAPSVTSLTLRGTSSKLAGSLLIGLLAGRLRALECATAIPDEDSLAVLSCCRELRTLKLVLPKPTPDAQPASLAHEIIIAELPLAWLAPLSQLQLLQLVCWHCGYPKSFEWTFGDAGLEALGQLAALESLTLHLRGDSCSTHQSARLCAAVAPLRKLRDLDLNYMPLDMSCLSALGGSASPLTSLCAGELLAPHHHPQQQQPLRHQAEGPLPRGLRRLCLQEAATVATLAALHPAPPSLEEIILQDLYTPSWLPAASLQRSGAVLDASVPLQLPAAVSLLAGRLVPASPERPPARRALKMLPTPEYPDNCRLLHGLPGAGHAAWLCGLGPLHLHLVELMLCKLALEVGDLRAMALALPTLEVLWLSECTFTPEALLGLGPLPQAKVLNVFDCDDSMRSSRAWAALTEVAARSGRLEKVVVRLRSPPGPVQPAAASDDDDDDESDGEEEDGDAFPWRNSALQAKAGLEMRGRGAVRIELVHDECSAMDY